MLGLLAPTLIALVAALACGGSVRGLVATRVRAWPAVLIGFGIELLLYNPPLDGQAWAMAIGPWVWLATRVVFVLVLVINGWSAGGTPNWPWRVAALGVALNTLVIAVNDGHMPQSPEAAVAVWGASHIDPGRLQNVAVMGPETRLVWLADIVAEPGWLPLRNVVSLGDILLAAGVALWVFTATRNKIGTRDGTRIYGAARPNQEPAR